jgi:hypothetical protein
MHPAAFSPLAGLVCLAASSLSVIAGVYTNEATFTVALHGALTRTNDFDLLHEGSLVHPVAWTNEGLACSIVSEPLLRLYGLPGALSTDAPGVKIVVRFTSGNVRAAGGLVYLTDQDGQPMAGELEVRVPGGPAIALASGGAPLAFTGVTSGGPLLTNLTLVSLTTNAYVTLDHLVVSEGQPWLELALAGNGQITVAWPAPATGYTLERKAAAEGSQWTPVPGTPVQAGDYWRLTLPAPGDGGWFRLRQP